MSCHSPGGDTAAALEFALSECYVNSLLIECPNGTIATAVNEVILVFREIK